jgi:xanthine/CO dehydrogenase XdhC/CoxF family maturation factor
MAPRTKPLFLSLLPESRQSMDTDHTTTSDQRDNNRTYPSREEVDGSWVVAQLLHNDVEGTHADTRNLLDVDANDVVEAKPNLAPTSEYDEAASNTDPSVVVCLFAHDKKHNKFTLA